MIKAGILGGSGYMGGEALRILLEHPKVEVVWATSRSGGNVSSVHRNMYGMDFSFIRPEEITPCDVVFIALPTGHAMHLASQLLYTGTKIIDLGADFRLRNKTEWEQIYGMPHESWSIAEEAVYGITELHRENIKQASVIANPGCFSSATILGLAPLVANDIIDTDKLVVDGLSGTAGIGAELHISAHHPELGNNLVPYNVVGHRHTYEIEQELGLLASSKSVSVHFTPTYVPITRGILSICHSFMKKSVTRERLSEIYKDFYQDEYFIKIFDMPKEQDVSWQYAPYPWVAATSGTNYCHIGFDVDEKRNRIVTFSALDSIGKGGAHVGVQNMNLMFGLNETEGLKRFGNHPY